MGLIPRSGRSARGGHDNTLQYSCWMENPMDRGAWQTTVQGVAKSWKQLKWLSINMNTWPFLICFGYALSLCWSSPIELSARDILREQIIYLFYHILGIIKEELNLPYLERKRPNSLRTHGYWTMVCTSRNSSYAPTAKSLQSCPTLCNPIDSSPPGSPVPGILQARTLEWVAISISNAESEMWKWSRSVVSYCLRPHGLQPSRLLHPWDFPGKSTGVERTWKSENPSVCFSDPLTSSPLSPENCMQANCNVCLNIIQIF